MSLREDKGGSGGILAEGRIGLIHQRWKMRNSSDMENDRIDQISRGGFFLN